MLHCRSKVTAGRTRRRFLREAIATTALAGVAALGWRKTWGADSEPLGLSLHCGLNHLDDKFYGGAPPLKGCHNDALDMQRIAEASGYRDSITLLDEQATRYEVHRHLCWAAKYLRAGDTFFVSVSSHGTAIPNEESNELDKTDEAWCLFDNVLLDHEFYALFKHFVPGVKVILVLDMCHSGTSYDAINLSRSRDQAVWDLPELKLESKGLSSDQELRNAQRLVGKGIVARELPNPLVQDIYDRHERNFVRRREAAQQRQNSIKRERPAGLMMVACLDGEEALDGEKNGLFTLGLTKSWKSGRYRSYARLFFSGLLNELQGTAQTPIIYPFGDNHGVWKDLLPFQL